MQNANEFSFQSLQVGQTSEHEYVLTGDVYESFLAAFSDRNPLHVDENYAKSKGFKGRVMHGAILNGFLSHFVGMIFPGRHSILLSTDLRFLKPNFIHDRLCLKAIVMHLSEAEKAVELRFDFHNLSEGYIAARGKLMVGLLDG